MHILYNILTNILERTNCNAIIFLFLVCFVEDEVKLGKYYKHNGIPNY